MVREKRVYVQVTDWLIRLNRNCDLLREKFEEFSKWEEAIEASYKEAQECLTDALRKAQLSFLEVKSRFLEEITCAINETRLHALETQTFHPGNPLSQLLWYCTPVDISTYHIFTFQSKCEKQFIDSVFQVSLQCVMSGFEHWKIERNESRVEGTRLTEVLQEERFHYQVLNQQYEMLTRHCANLETESGKLMKLVKDLELQVQTTAVSLHQKDEQCCALKAENARLVQEGKTQLRKSKRCFDWARIRLSELGEEPDSSRSSQKLIAVTSTEVRFFDTTTEQWQELYRLSSNINVNYSSAAVCIGENRVFVCGGGELGAKFVNPHVDNNAYVLEGNGTVLQQTNMSTGRYAPGVVFHSVSNAVYAFGGLNIGHLTMRSSEKFTFSSMRWEALPDMCENRAWFNPCIYAGSVYLCGGKSASVEQYDPKSNCFNLLSDFTLSENTSCIAVVQTGNLVVISKKEICWWNLQLRKVIGSKKHKEYGSWSNCTPVVVGDVVYMVDLPKKCCGIRMRDGEVDKEIAL